MRVHIEQVPEVFDWVAARGQCSSPQMFLLLTERVKSDVALMKARLQNTNQTLTYTQVSDDAVVVAKERHEGGYMFGGRNVMLKRIPAGVQVDAKASEGAEERMFVALVILSSDGRCRYEIDREPMELWQVSKRALENLFFS